MELMMVSGLPTASGYEERIRFAEMEIIDRGANEQGLIANAPQGQEIHGWDVNVAGVRTTSVKRHLRYHQHAEYILRVKKAGHNEIHIGRRFGQFVEMHKRLRLEMPGKVLPPLPRKNRNNASLFSSHDDDADSISSASTQDAKEVPQEKESSSGGGMGGLRAYLPFGGGGGHQKNKSTSSLTGRSSPRASMDSPRPAQHVLYREEQRVSLRAFLRNFIRNENIANSTAMKEFLTQDPITPNEEEMEDIEKRKEMDEKRMEEQKQFYEVARKRAAELDIHMEKFRRDIVERNGLRNLFSEIREKKHISELKPETQKFCEWIRIEVAATIYHLFLAEDNSPDLFAQAKRIHSMVPYTVLKNVIRLANPAAVMGGVLDLFLAQPFGSKSLMQRIFGMAIWDGVKQIQKSIDTLSAKINEPILCEKLKQYAEAEEHVKASIREEAADEQIDLVVAIERSQYLTPELSSEQVSKVFNAFVAWNSAVENVCRHLRLPSRSHGGSEDFNLTDYVLSQVDQEMRQGAVLFAQLKQLLKLHIRQRDKSMMLKMIEEVGANCFFSNTAMCRRIS